MAVAACGSSAPPEPPAPAPFDPVGTYTFETTVEGQPITGTVVIERTSTGFGGMITPEVGPPPIPVIGVVTDGRRVTITGDAEGEDLLIIIEVAEDGSYTGTWALGFDGGELVGRKVERP